MVHLIAMIVGGGAVVYATAVNDVRTFVLAFALILWEVYLNGLDDRKQEAD